MHHIRPLVLLLTIALVISPALAQDDVPTIYIYNNSGTLQFDAGGSDPVVLEEITNHIVEQIGVRPETIVPPGRGPVATEKLNLLLGSSDPIDLFQTPGPGYWHDYADAIIPINDLLEEYGQNILQVIPENQWAQMTDADGNIMGIPRSTPTSPYITWVRQDWLDELGLEVPATLEELEATIEAFQAHNPDAFVATRPQDITWSTLAGFTPNGRSNWLDPDDGMVKPWVLQPGVKDWLTKLNEWWNAGYFYPETFTNFDAPEVFRTCNLGVWMAWYSRITLITPQIESNCEGIEWARTSIVGPEGYIATSRPQNASAYVITRKAQNPEAVMKFMDWVYHADTTDNQLTARYGIKGTHWDYQDPETRTVEVYDSGYVSEYMLPNLNIEIRYSVLDPARAWHVQYLGSTLIDLSDAKKPFDADISYNLSRIAEDTPYLGDIQRLMDEQTILFITGARPLDQFDDFINELNMAGIGDWVNALTAQYNEFAG
ncbi:MAG: extracellular solute-binding protein [Anaerolineaceae bacterium]|nr:extracellular solute-binding protein [Anaerolineaceae bacterium]MDE0329286.1 extracellular solute-binding protein [Anaerolineaceae bacterium]